MAITVACAGCGKSFRVKDSHAGKRGKCPYCQEVIEIPLARGLAPEVNVAPPQIVRDKTPARAAPAQAGPAPQPAPTTAVLERQILGAFQGETARVRVSLVYRFGILLVAVFMVLLPLVYVGLIGLIGYAMYCHAVDNLGLLGLVKGSTWIIALAVYLAPLVAGVILLLFMVKPFFAPPAWERRTRSVTRKSDPLLFAFVDRVCAAVRAPPPKRIDVDCEVNASAAFRRGLWSMLGSDLVLTIGLPLAGGLTVRQFAGVLAHEFGHFTQGAGMRLTYLIRRVNAWLTRVVYERDAWDETLVRSCEDADWRIVLILQFARLLVWVTQKILWALMIVGHAVGGFMLRQMEYDADRHEIGLAGSDAFESTLRRLMLLSAAHQSARADLWQYSQEGRLPDNLPRLLLASVEHIPAESRANLDQIIDSSRTGFFDTHPSDKDRIARAHRENAPGIFHLDLPARVLFSDFDQLAKNVTWDVYCAVFGPRFQVSAMHPIDDLLARQDKEADAGRALGRYFQGMFTPLRPLPLATLSSETTVDPRACAARIRAGRKRMLDLAPAYGKTLAEYQKADRETVEADQATALSKADVKIRRTDFSTDLTSATAASRARRKAEERRERASAGLAEFEKAAADRLSAALELLQAPQIAARLENAQKWQDECARIVPAVRAIATDLPWVLTMRNEQAALGILLDRVEGNRRNEQFLWCVQRAAEALEVSIRQRREQLSIVPYPLDHAKGSMTVGDYVVVDLPWSEDVVAIFHVGRVAVENVLTLYVRLVGRLSFFAEHVEKALGLQPLPEPAGHGTPAEPK